MELELDPNVAACIPSTGPLRSYLNWAIKTTDAEHLFHLGSVLPCLADLVSSHGYLVDPERHLRPTIWTFLVGVSASSKTTAMKRAQTHYQRVLTSMANGQPARPFIFAEGSIPGLFEALAARYNPETNLSTGVVDRDEAARLLDSKDGTTADMLCQIIDGEEVERHLRAYKAESRAGGAPPDRLKRPAFSGRLATTFARIREVTQASYLEGGLYSRMIWFVGQECHPHPALEIRIFREEGERVAQEWLDWGRWLLAGKLGDPEDMVVSLAPEAVELLRGTLFEDFRTAARTDSRLNATRKRSLTQAVIVAGLYALSQQRFRIELEDMERAVNLLLLSMGGLEGLETTLAVEDDIQNVERCYRIVRQAGELGAPKADLYRTRLTKRQIDDAIAHLLDAGRICQVKDDRVGPGRREVRYRSTSLVSPTRVQELAEVLRLRPASEDAPEAPEASSELADGSASDPVAR